jgi:sugar phosphate isomerase/epimerase
MSRRALAVCSWSMRPAGPGELVDRLRAAGMGRVQLALVPLLDAPLAWADVAERLRDAGIAIQSGMLAPRGEDYSSIPRIRETGGLRPDATWADNQKLAMGAARAAATLGIALVTFHAGFIPHDRADPLRARMIDRLRGMVDLFAEEGVRVAFETGQESADGLLEALRDIDRPEAGVNFDPANMLLYGAGDPLEGFRKLRGWVRQIHAKDATPSGQPDVWGRETPVGAGAVPWREFMAEVATLAPEVGVVIEREGGERRVQEVASAREFLHPML